MYENLKSQCDYTDMNVAVIGDIMLDHWREGHEYRLSPEGAHLDIANPGSQYSLGGAGNVARIVRSLGARCQLLSVYGEFTPYANSQILDLCDKAGIGFYAAYEPRKTTVKERIVCGGQPICRISEEDTDWISPDSAGELIDILDGLEGLDCIIVADYAKGVMRDMIVHGVYHIAQKMGIPTLVDPKKRLYIYKGCTIMKPNKKEYNALTKTDVLDMQRVRDDLDAEHLVVTSENGMRWCSRNDFSVFLVISHPVEIANVSGCGDAAAAVMALEYVRSNHDIERSVKLANWAASRVVQRERTGYLDIKDLEEFYEWGDEQSDISGQRRSDKQTVNQSS